MLDFRGIFKVYLHVMPGQYARVSKGHISRACAGRVGGMISMSDIMVRACHKCKVYVCIHSDDVVNQRMMKAFDGEHSRHMIQSVVLSEVQGIYREIPCSPASLTGNLLNAPSAGEVGRGHA